MTCRTFDPRNFSSYPADKAPQILHFQYKHSEDVFRYVLVERIPLNEINRATRRKEGEGQDEDVIRKKYLNG